jgi:sugar phosphate isomerase/epimerase
VHVCCRSAYCCGLHEWKCEADGGQQLEKALLAHAPTLGQPVWHCCGGAVPGMQRCVETFQREVQQLSKQQPVEEWAETLKMMKSCEEFAAAHEAVIAKWGRFPHRNAVLQRQNTPEEEEGIRTGSIPRW